MCCPSTGALLIVTVCVPPSVHSTGTTASAPAGTGAPVMIRTANPGCTTIDAALPAARSPETCNCTGAVSEAAATSACRTAYPSIAELSNGGIEPVATTSSASTQPCASLRVSGNGCSASTVRRISSRCSSTDLTAG